MSTSSTKDRIILDGSFGEGGGQLVRNAVSLASLLQIPLEIQNIRAKRSQPGLKAQHVIAVRLAAQMSGGTLVGDAVGSNSIVYSPDPKEHSFCQHVTGDTKTAGSICLLLQAWLPCALFSPGIDEYSALLCGGTNASMAPQYDYWALVFWPTLRDACLLDQYQIIPRLLRRGYFPKGGGKVKVDCKPVSSLKPINLTDRGTVDFVIIRAYYADQIPRSMVDKMVNTAQFRLQDSLDESVRVYIEEDSDKTSVGAGLGIVIVAATSSGCRLAGSSLSTPKTTPSKVAHSAVDELLTALNEGGCVDEWLQDQLIIYMALADGKSEILTGCLTLHTRTAIAIAERMVPGVRFEVEALDGRQDQKKTQNVEYGKDGRISGKHLIRCHGVGFSRASK